MLVSRLIDVDFDTALPLFYNSQLGLFLLSLNRLMTNPLARYANGKRQNFVHVHSRGEESSYVVIRLSGWRFHERELRNRKERCMYVERSNLL